jgi:hypothetical protein
MKIRVAIEDIRPLEVKPPAHPLSADRRVRCGPRGMFTALACLSLLAGADPFSPARAESIPAIHFHPGEGIRNEEDTYFFGERGWGYWGVYFEQHTAGWAFTLTEPATLSHLAVFDEGGDGLATSFQVGLWASEDSPVTSAIVPAGEQAPLRGLWRLAAVEPITLEAGTFYQIGAAPTAPTTDRLFFLNFDPVTIPPIHDPSAVPFDPRVDVSLSSPSHSSENDFHAPDGILLVIGAYFGPNVFLVAPIPEPNAGLIVVICAVACGLWKGARAVRRRLRYSALAALLVAINALATCHAESIPAIHFDPSEGVCNTEGTCLLNGSRGWFLEPGYVQSRTYGWDFQLSHPATVTHLAVADAGMDELDVAFQVAIWQSDIEIGASLMSSVLLDEATVPAGDAAELRGLWRRVEVEPLDLAPGYRYVVGAAPVAPTGDANFFWNFDPGLQDIDIEAISVDPRVMMDGAYPRFSDASGFVYPNGALAVRGAYVGPNIYLLAVPEPGGLPLVLVLVAVAAAGNPLRTVVYSR